MRLLRVRLSCECLAPPPTLTSRARCPLQRVEAALAAAWGGGGPAPTRPPPPSLFVAAEDRVARRVGPAKSETERPFGFVRDELERFSLESRGGGSRKGKGGGGDKPLKNSAHGRMQQPRMQLCSSSSSSSGGHVSDGSEDSLQADACATVIHRGVRSSRGGDSSSSSSGGGGGGGGAALPADASARDSDSEVRAPPQKKILPRYRFLVT